MVKTKHRAFAKELGMVIVAGHLIVDPEHRATYLAECRAVTEQARRAPGCLDFSVTADLLEADRVVIFEHWESQDAVNAFRGSGPGEEQTAAITSASVTEYDVRGERRLT
jgi:quinol monooxygenase YgiN